MPPNRWIECECPHQKVDFDTDGFLLPDALIDCPHCGQKHRADQIGQLVVEGEDGTLAYHSTWTAKDADPGYRHAWLAGREVGVQEMADFVDCDCGSKADVLRHNHSHWPCPRFENPDDCRARLAALMRQQYLDDPFYEP